jgi:hypothetical protein
MLCKRKKEKKRKLGSSQFLKTPIVAEAFFIFVFFFFLALFCLGVSACEWPHILCGCSREIN